MPGEGTAALAAALGELAASGIFALIAARFFGAEEALRPVIAMFTRLKRIWPRRNQFSVFEVGLPADEAGVHQDLPAAARGPAPCARVRGE